MQMSTKEKLQERLKGNVTIINGYDFKTVAPTVVCKDGSELSVQASWGHYCTPRDNFGPYTHVEVWCHSGSTPITEFSYYEDGPSAQVNIDAVVEYIDNRGGFKD